MNVSKIADKIQKNPSQTVDLYLDSLDELVEYENYGERSRKSLNPKINDYLMEAAKEITIKYSIRLVIHARNIDYSKTDAYENLIKGFYEKQTQALLRDRKKKSKQWRIRLFFGIAFLAACHGVSLLFSLMGDTSFANLMQDSFEIMGWVAIWEPVLYFLFTRKDETYELSDYIQLEKLNIVFEELND